jgi:hypothetical protein
VERLSCAGVHRVGYSCAVGLDPMAVVARCCNRGIR